MHRNIGAASCLLGIGTKLVVKLWGDEDAFTPKGDVFIVRFSVAPRAFDNPDEGGLWLQRLRGSRLALIRHSWALRIARERTGQRKALNLSGKSHSLLPTSDSCGNPLREDQGLLVPTTCISSSSTFPSLSPDPGTDSLQHANTRMEECRDNSSSNWY